MSIKPNDIIFLLGAGCSFDAGIPVSAGMVKNTEELLNYNEQWKKYRAIYNYLKSTILYGDNLVSKQADFNIERLLNTLTELEKNKKSILFPFIMGWNQTLLDISKNMELITEFKNKIIEQLPKWVTKDDYSESKYYEKFYLFQREWQYPLRIFSLNYDLCMESNKLTDFYLEKGFRQQDYTWDGNLFYIENPDINIYLYKLHGSIDWYRTSGNILKISSRAGVNEADLIFGTDVKLQSIDPYLFYVYEFRKYSLECKLLIIIGYSYSDNYINNLIKQALVYDPNMKILNISPFNTDTNYKDELLSKLNYSNGSQLITINKKAKDFLINDLTLTYVENYLNNTDEELF